MYKKILIPVDGSEKASLAARQAAELASILGSEVTLFHVVPILPVDRFRSIVIEESRLQGKELLEQARKELDQFNITIDTDMVPGHPADAICLKARVDKYDLIIMGSRGLSGVKGYLMGSVSSAVTRYAPCSVLIVR
ncbi:putative universal stress protein [Pelotomaculum schinkii]|uniref:Putative universal stress protein n=1 Tax=Pelotomaculum schinkii TaxID=78350 RepID=A0A4Y7RAN5_9FIRM|nr:universal stress protein [Pelotomaculum schinkii]TEB05856.1 putative universal stress protein [Pelotomaculum schinkii]